VDKTKPRKAKRCAANVVNIFRFKGLRPVRDLPTVPATVILLPVIRVELPCDVQER
jgi:hypothetical protein